MNVVVDTDTRVSLPNTKGGFGELVPLEAFGWSLPGHGVSRADCGVIVLTGCLDVESHMQPDLDGDSHVGKAFFDVGKVSCGKFECPVCYEKAAGKEAHKIDYRLSQYKVKSKPIHVIVSVPRTLYNVPGELLRSRVYKAARAVGFWGGSSIFHPFREICVACGAHKDTETKTCENCGCSEFLWVYSPHFHLIGFGWINGDKVSAQHKKTGWIVKNAGVRLSVMATAFYQLSHCGVKKGFATVTWFGCCSYSKLKVAKEVVDKKTCPICGAELVKVRWVGEGEPNIPLVEGEYFADPGGWSTHTFDFGEWMRGRPRWNMYEEG